MQQKCLSMRSSTFIQPLSRRISIAKLKSQRLFPLQSSLIHFHLHRLFLTAQ
uniref:Uncharacterized protein n=1 Tax=Lotus japonicus TaxID=34305 RepID=I3T1V5_LOTJA|nr:unknown [Lotus japonicus]